MSCGLRDNILKFDRPVPRYTSYPTAPNFVPMTNKTLYDQWLRALPEGARISLYLHVPYCSKMCWYCGCNTKITQRYAPVEDYVHLMLREIDILSEKIPASHIVADIHFGGGSPGLMRAIDFNLVMSHLKTRFQFDNNPTISIELDPRGVTEARVAAYARQGVNRVSLGVQDFDDTVLESVNRQQPFFLSYDAIRLLRDYGINNINVDLLYGLPHQSLKTMDETIDKILLLDPDRVSLFGYAHVPWMKKHMRLINEEALPQKELRFDLFEAGAQKLLSAGYEAVGIDHFAKPQDPLARAARSRTLRRNFQGYVTDMPDALIGIGASSIGKFPQGYIQNAADIPYYKESILSEHLPVSKICTMSKDDHIHAHIIEKIMCDFEIDLNAVIKDHDLPCEYFKENLSLLNVYIKQGFVNIDNGHIVRVTPAGRPLTRLIAAAFDAYYSDILPATKKHARAI